MATAALSQADRCRYNEMQQSSTQQFVSTVTALVRLLHGKNKSNADFNEVRDKWMNGKDVAPESLIFKAAPSVYKYGTQVKARNEAWLLSYNFNETIIAHMEVPETDNINLMERTITQARNVWRGLSAAEKDGIWRDLASILTSVCQYSLASRKLGTEIITEAVKEEMRNIDEAVAAKYSPAAST